MCGLLLLQVGFYLPRRNLNYFSNAYAAAVSAVDPDAGNGELCIKVPSELWKHVDGKAPGMYYYREISLAKWVLD
jgi:transcription initiation factor TFIID subunit 2